jgi:hypothetical protein
VANSTNAWQSVAARSEELIDAVKFECIVSGLLGTTAQDLSFEAIRSCLRAKFLQEQQTGRTEAPTGHRPDGPMADHPAELRSHVSASRDAIQSVDDGDDRLKVLQRNVVRAQLYVADAHERAAQSHEKSAENGLGDVQAHRQAADRHRSARQEALRRRWAYLMAATLNLISDGGDPPPVSLATRLE